MLHLPIPLALVPVHFTLSILKYTDRLTLLLYFLKYAPLFALFVTYLLLSLFAVTVCLCKPLSPYACTVSQPLLH